MKFDKSYAGPVDERRMILYLSKIKLPLIWLNEANVIISFENFFSKWLK